MLKQILCFSLLFAAVLAKGSVCDETAKFGNTYKEGEEHRASHLIYKCENGFMHPKGCYVEGRDIEVGEKYIDKAKNSRHECYQAGTIIGYREVCPADSP